MAVRSRRSSEDFNNSNYDRQYTDDEASDSVHLDHRRLYITRISPGLNEVGLRAAFSKFGALNECFVNNDPNKRYGLVSFETAGEASLAMMKMNKTEPLKLNISIAHKTGAGKKKNNNDRRDKEFNNRDSDRHQRDKNNSYNKKEHHKERKDHHRDCMVEKNNGWEKEKYRERDDSSSGWGEGSRGHRQDSGSVTGKRNRRQVDMANGDNNVSIDNLPVERDSEMNLESLDSDLQLQLEQLEMEQLKVRQKELELKKKILMKQAKGRDVPQSSVQTTRTMLPDGRMVVRNITVERQERSEHHDGDSSFAAGGGDSSNIPALQSTGSRTCVACGAASDAFCSHCGVTPYCSPRCQRRDWADRHRAVCHNLARRYTVQPEGADPVEPEAILPVVAPLRRPRSPLPSHKAEPASPRRDFDDIPKNFVPAGGNINFCRVGGGRTSTVGARLGRQPSKPTDKSGAAGKAMSKETAKDAPEVSLPPRAFRTDQHTPKTRDVVSLMRSTDPPTSVPNAGAPPRSSLKLEDPKPQVKVEANKPPASVADVAPVKKLVPKNYVVETLSIGDVVLLSVDNTAAACGAEGAGFVCLCLHETAAQHYAALCDQYGAACDADKQQHQPAPGETFSYFNQAEGAWYRSRCLGAGSAALLDGSKVVALSAADRCRRLPAEYQHVPEFCCVLQADNVKIGDNLKCTLMAKTPCGYKVSVEDAESGAQRGDGALARWQPRVQHPPALKPATAQPAAIPEVQRPPVTHGGKVLVVDATAAELVYVRAADTANKMQFDTVLQDVVLHGHTGTPMTEPPQQGQVVIAKFTDGLHYRALVKRTNVKLNKYLLEYIEYGNTHVSPLEDLYACPATLDVAAHPAMTSRVTLRLDADATLAPPAQHYLDKLKEDETELILTLPNGEESAPSGSEVILTVAKNKQCVNKTLQEMCTPDWKKIDEHGGDVVETKNLMFSELRHLELPAQGCEIEVLDFSAIQIGIVSGCERGLPHAQRVFTQLTEQMEKYCNSELCREPYLPKGEELCIAQCPPYPQWFRAVLIGQAAPGGDEAEVMYVDYGNIERVPVTLLRKMLPEFVRGLPAVAATLVIADFPANPTPEMLSKALQHMQVNEEGRGVLRVTKCVKDDCGMYTVHAPALIAAMTQ